MPKSKQKSKTQETGISGMRRGQGSGEPGVSASQSRVTSSQGRVTSSQQPTSTQAEKALSSFNQHDVDRRVNDLVQYFLIMDQKKLPIKKLDINKHVLKEFSKAFPLLIEKARLKLLNVFGIELVELTDKHKGSFILVNELENDSDAPHLVWSPENNAKTGLLMTILSLIFMNGNVMTDGEMWHALKRFGIEPEITHNVFGDVKKLITTEFVRQGYLEYTRQPNTDPPIHDLKWGQRSKQESSKRHVLDFVCQIYNMEAEQWTSQWQDVLQSEGALGENED